MCRKMLFSMALLFVLGVTAVANAATFKLATNVNDDGVAGRQIAELAENIRSRTDGRISFKIFANGVLGDQMQYFQQIQKGVIEAGLVNGAALENVIPAMGVLNLPYVFRDSAEYSKVISDPRILDYFNKEAEPHSFVPLGFLASGFRSIYSTKPVKTAADLAGLKLRSLSSETYIKTLTLFGAVPTPLPFGELYSAMQMGIVDGAEGGLAGLWEMKFGEVAKFAIRTEQTRLTDFIVASTRFLKRISPEDLAVVREEFAKISAKSVAVADEDDAHNISLAEKELGVTVVDVDKEPLIQAVEPLYHEAMQDPAKKELLTLIFDVEGRKL